MIKTIRVGDEVQKTTAKIVILPVMSLVLIAQWIGLFFTGIVSIVLEILSNLFWGFAIVGFLFGALTGHETIEMLVVLFAVLIIQQISY